MSEENSIFEMKPMKYKKKEIMEINKEEKYYKSPKRNYQNFDEPTNNDIERLAQQINQILQQVPTEKRDQSKY